MSGPSSILHLIDTGGPGGAETIFLELSTGVDPARWRSLAVVPSTDWLHGALFEAGSRPLVRRNSGSWDLKYLLWLLGVVRRHSIDLIHAHLLGSAVYASAAGMLIGIPVVATFHGRSDLPDEGRFLRTKIRLLNRPRNHVVFVSESLRASVLSRHSLDSRRTRVIHNGVREQPMTPVPDGRAFPELPHDAFVMGAIGNLRPAKDYPTMLSAVAILRQRGLPAVLVIAGEAVGRSREELLKHARALRIEDAVHLLGFQPNPRRLLPLFDVVVSSSRYEGFSLSVVEALQAAVPVVATRSGGPEEIIRAGETGDLVPVGDPGALAEALVRVYQERSRATAMAREGQADVLSRFSLSKMIDAYERLYGEALGVRSLEPQVN